MNSGNNYKRMFHVEYMNGRKEDFEDIHTVEYKDGVIFIYGMLDVTKILSNEIRFWDIYFVSEARL